MRKIVLLLSFFCLLSCKQKKEENSTLEVVSKTAVTITHVTNGRIKDEIILSATTAYLKKATISSPIAGFITKVYVQQGQRVRKGQLLYCMESKEKQALGNQTVSATMGVVDINASESGIVTTVSQQKGAYALEGTSLCTIAVTSSFVFELNVPYEYLHYVHSGKKCTLILPDNSKVAATINLPLITMNIASQTQQVLARAKTSFLPEGMVVKALLDKESEKTEMQLLPKAAIQSDESMHHFWVMRLVNDTLAIKTPVTIGHSNTEEVEISSPHLSPAEKIILSGGYAMEDSTIVRLVKN